MKKIITFLDLNRDGKISFWEILLTLLAAHGFVDVCAIIINFLIN